MTKKSCECGSSWSSEGISAVPDTDISYSRATNWLGFEGHGFRYQDCKSHLPKNCIFKNRFGRVIGGFATFGILKSKCQRSFKVMTSVIFVNENENENGEKEKITNSLTKTKTKKWWKLKRKNRKRLKTKTKKLKTKTKMPKQQNLSLNESASIQYGAYGCYGRTALNRWLTVDGI